MKPAKVYMRVDMHELITGVTDRLELLQLFSDAERKQPEDRLPGALAFHGTWQINCCNVATHMVHEKIGYSPPLDTHSAVLTHADAPPEDAMTVSPEEPQ